MLSCSVEWETKAFTYDAGGVQHQAVMQCRDPALVLQEKLLDNLGKRSTHPVNIIPGCFDAETRRKLSSSLPIAHLPHVDGAEERKAMFAAAMNVICASLNHAGRHGVDMHIRLGEVPAGSV